jgi:hypothetical protein
MQKCFLCLTTKKFQLREGAERIALDTFITAFEIVPVDEVVAVKGGLYRRDYGKRTRSSPPPRKLAQQLW